jgi:PhzF family phenazine biosynthesis protein
MQSLASEMNLSETAFVVPEAGSSFGVRWFTPETEVPLCGHATLAAAHVLFEAGHARDAMRIQFTSASGRLTAARIDGRIELDFPAHPVTECGAPDGLVAALGVSPELVGRTPVRGSGDVDYLCLLADETMVRSLQPDVDALRLIRAGIIVTAAGSGRHAIVSRFFAPSVGLNEDPVTGVAHCALAPFWAPRLGSDHFLAWQASKRGGEVAVTLRGSRVGLAGHAVIVADGRCRV